MLFGDLRVADDAARFCLLATLLTLVPRSGVLTLALLLGWLPGSIVVLLSYAAWSLVAVLLRRRARRKHVQV